MTTTTKKTQNNEVILCTDFWHIHWSHLQASKDVTIPKWWNHYSPRKCSRHEFAICLRCSSHLIGKKNVEEERHCLYPRGFVRFYSEKSGFLLPSDFYLSVYSFWLKLACKVGSVVTLQCSNFTVFKILVEFFEVELKKISLTIWYWLSVLSISSSEGVTNSSCWK